MNVKRTAKKWEEVKSRRRCQGQRSPTPSSSITSDDVAEVDAEAKRRRLVTGLACQSMREKHEGQKGRRSSSGITWSVFSVSLHPVPNSTWSPPSTQPWCHVSTASVPEGGKAHISEKTFAVLEAESPDYSRLGSTRLVRSHRAMNMLDSAWCHQIELSFSALTEGEGKKSLWDFDHDSLTKKPRQMRETIVSQSLFRTSHVTQEPASIGPGRNRTQSEVLTRSRPRALISLG